MVFRSGEIAFLIMITGFAVVLARAQAMALVNGQPIELMLVELFSFEYRS